MKAGERGRSNAGFVDYEYCAEGPVSLSLYLLAIVQRCLVLTSSKREERERARELFVEPWVSLVDNNTQLVPASLFTTFTAR